jgi:hypothetical protein
LAERMTAELAESQDVIQRLRHDNAVLKRSETDTVKARHDDGGGGEGGGEVDR